MLGHYGYASAAFGKDHNTPVDQPWAGLLRRVFAIDVLTCPHCGGSCRLIAFLTDPPVVRKILAHLGHPTDPPVPAPPRSTAELQLA